MLQKNLKTFKNKKTLKTCFSLQNTQTLKKRFYNYAQYYLFRSRLNQEENLTVFISFICEYNPVERQINKQTKVET